jgi:hypothetical protein
MFLALFASCARDSGMETVDQYSLLQWLVKIAPNSLTEHPRLDAIIRVSGDENRWDRLPCSVQVHEQLDAGHFRHVNIGDQAGGRRESGGCKKLGGGWKYRNAIAERFEQPAHGIAKGLIVIDD